MQNASEAITNLMASLENYYDAARNAMLVKKAVKKYGKTQSIVALIGQEGLAAAQSFSMEGFWQKVKDFVLKIWEKIKEWWGRFWGMFFSVEKKLESFVNDVKGKNLQHPCEFDGIRIKELKSAFDQFDRIVKTIKDAVSASDMTTVDTILAKLANYDTSEGSTSGKYLGFNVLSNPVRLAFKTGDEVADEGTSLLTILKKCATAKKDIDEYTKKALDNIKKITASGDDTEKVEKLLDVLKKAAKLNNNYAGALSKAATSQAAKLMAHTRLVA